MKKWIPAAAAAMVAMAAMAQAAAPEWVAAKVIKVDTGRSRVTLDHARIRSIDMEPMVMPFRVSQAVDLRQFRPGDKVRFTFASQDDHLVVEAMEKLP